MFINTKKTFKITSDNGIVFEARTGWIGEVPKWVEEHWYFKALCDDGSVTSIVSSKDKDIENAVEPPKPDGKTTKGKPYVPPSIAETPKADGGKSGSDSDASGSPPVTADF
jgi:hypothetical protein